MSKKKIPEPISGKIERALQLHKAGGFGKAESHYKSILKDYPDHPEVLNFLGLLSYQTNKHLNAIRYLKKSVSLNPSSAVAHNNLGLALHELGRFDEACESYEDAIKINPGLASAYNNFANTLKAIGNFEGAFTNYRIALKISPNYVKAINNLGVALQATGQVEEAVKCFNRAILMEKSFAEPHFNLGSVLLEQGHLKEAVASFREATNASPDHSQAHNNLGLALQKLCRFTEAIDSFCSANTKSSHAKLLECLYQQERYDDFYRKLKVMISIDKANLGVAAISAFVSYQLQREDPYPFCKKPLNFLKVCQFQEQITKTGGLIDRVIGESLEKNMLWEPSGISTNAGFQTKDDLFVNPGEAISELFQFIKSEIATYYLENKFQSCEFINAWPEDIKIKGWFVRLLKSGYQSEHIHPDGWLSGVIYLSVPESAVGDEGAIEFSLNGGFAPILDADYPRVRHNPKKGQLVLFPSSLFHRTIPTTTDQERLSIAFDLMPD